MCANCLFYSTIREVLQGSPHALTLMSQRCSVRGSLLAVTHRAVARCCADKGCLLLNTRVHGGGLSPAEHAGRCVHSARLSPAEHAVCMVAGCLLLNTRCYVHSAKLSPAEHACAGRTRRAACTRETALACAVAWLIATPCAVKRLPPCARQVNSVRAVEDFARTPRTVLAVTHGACVGTQKPSPSEQRKPPLFPPFTFFLNSLNHFRL